MAVPMPHILLRKCWNYHQFLRSYFVAFSCNHMLNTISGNWSNRKYFRSFKNVNSISNELLWFPILIFINSKDSMITLSYLMKLLANIMDITIFMFLGISAISEFWVHWNTAFVIWTLIFISVYRVISGYFVGGFLIHFSFESNLILLYYRGWIKNTNTMSFKMIHF